VPDLPDSVIERLAHDGPKWLDEVVELTVQRDAYQLLAQQAIHLCHAQYVELMRLRASHDRLLTRLRALREQTMPSEREAV
jgi:hypothetical protein